MDDMTALDRLDMAQAMLEDVNHDEATLLHELGRQARVWRTDDGWAAWVAVRLDADADAFGDAFAAAIKAGYMRCGFSANLVLPIGDDCDDWLIAYMVGWDDTPAMTVDIPAHRSMVDSVEPKEG